MYGIHSKSCDKIFQIVRQLDAIYVENLPFGVRIITQSWITIPYSAGYPVQSELSMRELYFQRGIYLFQCGVYLYKRRKQSIQYWKNCVC
jgi:hypothetical protein